MAPSRAFAAGHFWFMQGNKPLDYPLRFGIRIPYAVDKFGYGGKNGMQYYDFGADEFLFNLSSRDISRLALTSQLGLTFAAAAASSRTAFLSAQHTVPAAPGPYTITLAQIPIAAGAICVHGIRSSIDEHYVYNVGAPAAGEFQWVAGTTITFNVADAGNVVDVDYYYADAVVGYSAATTPSSFVPQAVNAYAAIRLGPQNAARDMYLTTYVPNLVRAGGEFSLDAEHHKIAGPYDLVYAPSDPSAMRWGITG